MLDRIARLFDGEAEETNERTTSPAVESERRRPPTADRLFEAGWLTPEEYLERVLAANGGWMRQRDLVEATTRSAGSVSRTLSTMEDAGRVVRVRDGREKLVFLPDRVPADHGVDADSSAESSGSGEPI